MSEFVTNRAGRRVPTEVNGIPQVPYKGVAQHIPDGRKWGAPIPTCARSPLDKRVKDLRTALEMAGLKDGMTIGIHHHFRNGDLIVNPLFDTIADMGIRDIVFAPSALFPCHEPLIRHLESGVIHHIEGSMNGPIGRFCSEGKMRGMGILRSHGGRYQAIQDGELKIDIGIIPAPCSDIMGNANGVNGPSACGPLGFGLADSLYADKVILITDHIVPFPCIPWEIQGQHVDYVVVLDRVGDPSQIVSGTTRITKSPTRLLIAEYVSRFIEAAGYLGQSFQAGAGGISLAFIQFMAQRMREKGIKVPFARGGSTQYLVELLEEGLIGSILDGQSFDLAGVKSLRDHPNHVATSPLTSYNYHSKGNFAPYVGVAVLGATEVDISFNANVVTHSDGYLLHGIGGWQNALFADMTILAFPLYRGRIPIIVEEVTTLCGPSELVDVIVTERGIAINPGRNDLISETRKKGLPIVSIEELHDIALKTCGKPQAPRLDKDHATAVIKWVDGTVMDSAFRVLSPGA
ncbi:MAG TPA: citrate lyase subunit alpha [Thermoanaerobaculia bacterium]|nr:citrate lyase subunit alpha [Thermoanaerobaculia bacterium]HUM30524.1 citrate lyase subunit alpha [Thermoanaerobaculia bacterium]HXK68716.1 citrate lyase subunit alpha [Thermoanaerobaculia bacterium]